MEHIVILGNGISGVTAARHIRKRSAKRITIVSGESDYFFSRTALMYVYMGHMKFEHTQPYENHFWEDNNIELKRAWVKSIDFESKTLKFEGHETMHYDKLVLAVGSKSNKFGWKGQDLPGVQGLYSAQDLELLEKNTHPYGAKGDQKKVDHAVIVGGGLIGVELAEMLMVRGVKVSFLVREDKFWGNVLPTEEGLIVKNHLIEHGVDLRLNSELEEIVAGDDGRVCAVITKSGERIDCQVVGLTAGVSPNVSFLKESALDVDRGVLIDRHFKTNIEDVYAIGDCAQFTDPVAGRRPLEQVWYTGRIMGETLALTLTDEPTEYQPGFWFNSAKFFDVEYQTYGTVLAELQEGQGQFYWEHVNGKICFKMVYDQSDFTLVGINVFGLRLRHIVCDGWLKENRTIDHVIAHLKDAAFDPELYVKHEVAIADEFNRQFPDRVVKLKKRSWKRILSLTK